MDAEWTRWVIGICIGLILTLIGVVFSFVIKELARQAKNIHELRDSIPQIVKQWVRFHLRSKGKEDEE